MMPAPIKSPLRAIDVPEVVDNMGESQTARLMRLAVSYYRLNPSPDLKKLNEDAFSALNRFSGLLPQTGLLGGSLYCSTAYMIDDESAVVVGPDSGAIADELFRAAPVRLVAPALPTFPHTAPGVYIIQNGKAGPPTTSEEARAALMPSLNPG
jgi:hypothetical protein